MCATITPLSPLSLSLFERPYYKEVKTLCMITPRRHIDHGRCHIRPACVMSQLGSYSMVTSLRGLSVLSLHTIAYSKRLNDACSAAGTSSQDDPFWSASKVAQGSSCSQSVCIALRSMVTTHSVTTVIHVETWGESCSTTLTWQHGSMAT